MSLTERISTRQRRRQLRRWLFCLIAVPTGSIAVDSVGANGQEPCQPAPIVEACPVPCFVDPCAPAPPAMIESAPTAKGPMAELLKDDASEPTDAPEPTPELNETPVADDVADPSVNFSSPVTEVPPSNFNLRSGLSRTAGTAGALAMADTPNMMGDFLGGGRNNSFEYNFAGDGNPSFGSGGSVVTNSKVSDNNSAIARDRVTFRYHFFDDAATQQELRATGDKIRVDFNTVSLVNQDVVRGTTTDYDTHLFEFGFERRLSENVSLEFRLPFVASLDSRQDLSATSPLVESGTIFGFSDPSGTTAIENVEFRDISLISKFMLVRTKDTVISSGLGTRLPTSPTSGATVFDGLNTDPNDDVQVFGLDPGGDPNNVADYNQVLPDRPYITLFRLRDFETDLNTVSLTPFLAIAKNLGCDTFFNGFLSLDVPIGTNSVSYQESFLDAVGGTGYIDGTTSNGSLVIDGTNFNTYTSAISEQDIREQTLLNLDMSIGHWIYQSRHRTSMLRRVALLGELHYMTTLNDADVAEFNSLAPNVNFNSGLPVGPGNEEFLQAQIYDEDTDTFRDESPLRVGNLANRLDVLNANVGVVSQWGDGLTMATGVGVPLRNEDDSLFDWELQFQLNYYPGGFVGLPTMF
ncbi:MAG: hypothetical protein AAGC97_04055 [Planctomycetota bacterium]